MREELTDTGRVITYEGEQPLSVYIDLITCLTYMNSLDEPEPRRKNVTIQVFTPGESGAAIESNIAQVTIEILPVNDYAPIFDQNSYEGTVLENAPLGTSTGVTVSATDADVFSGTSITYEIPGDNEYFAVDSITGVVTTLLPLDADIGDRFYRFLIVASDNDDPVRTTAVNVTIEVLDENDITPQFNQTLYATSVPEDAAVDTSVLQVFGDDRDSSDSNSAITYRIDPFGASFGSGSAIASTIPFDIDQVSGVITILESLDFETTRVYTITVLAEDQGSPALTGTTQVQISVLDANDNPPEFIDAPYYVNTSENTPIATTVLTVTATDSDSSSNGQIVYSLQGTTLFDINPSTGEVFINEIIDYEIIRSLNFTVIARDSGDLPQSSTAQVYVVVINENDNPPFFDPSSYVFTVREGYGLQEQVFASDADGDQLTYLLTSDIFVINSTTGKLRSVDGFQFDYEVQTQYNFEVQVTDGLLSASANVTIDVQDENNLPPQFELDVYSTTVSENASIGASVTQVRATDGDTGTNAEIEYSIAVGNTGNVFTIDQNSGEITVASTLDFELEPTMYTLIILARNTAPPFLNDTANVIINITDANDIQPMLSLDPLNITFVENSASVLLASNLLVTDPDTHPLTQCTITLLRGPCGLTLEELAEACGTSEGCNGQCAESIAIDETLLSEGLSLSDTDDSESQTITISGSASDIMYQGVLRSLMYSNLASEPESKTRLVDIQCADNLRSSNTIQISIAVELRDEFCVEINATQSVFDYYEDMGSLAIGELAGFSLMDRDRSPHQLISEIQIVLENPLDDSYETISVTSDVPGLIITTINTEPSSGLELVTDDMLSPPVFNSVTIQITGEATPDDYAQVLQTLAYTNIRSEPTQGTRQITVIPFSDAPGCSPFQIEITVRLLNDNPPELILNTTDTLFYIEESGFLSFAAEAGLQVVDADHNDVFNMEAANVTLIGVEDEGQESLGYDPGLLPTGVDVMSSDGGMYVRSHPYLDIDICLETECFPHSHMEYAILISHYDRYL